MKIVLISLLLGLVIAAGSGASVFTDRPPAGKIHAETNNWHRVPELPQSSSDDWPNLRSTRMSPRILSNAGDRMHPSNLDRMPPPLTIDQISYPLNIDRMNPSNVDRKLSSAGIAHSSHSCQKILIVECL